jgi:ABC-type nitrate/sulfonate/bicarbonate transport system permease component
MNEQLASESVDPRDRWCVNCQRNVFAQKAGTSLVMLTVAFVLLIVLGGLVGIGIGALLESASGGDFSLLAPMAIGAAIGLVVAWAAIGADEQRCAICKSSNLKDAR